MENTDSTSKQAALDNKSAYAGNVSPDPEVDTEELGMRAGLDIKPGKPLSVAEDLHRRDQHRYELDVDSKAEAGSSKTEAASVDITKTETGQIEAIPTQPIQSGSASG